MSIQYSDMQLDALRELANIGSGTASTALSGMLGRTVDISVPNALVLPIAEAVAFTGCPTASTTGIVLGVIGDMEATVILLVSPGSAALLCGLLGVEAGTEIGLSALQEIGNIVGASYVNALGAMTGMELEPTPPSTQTDELAPLVEAVIAGRARPADRALLLDSDLVLEGEDCEISFLLVPDRGGVEKMLDRLGLG